MFKVVSSATLQKNMKIVINAQGLANFPALRGAQDGYTFFGRKKNIKKVNNVDHDHESTTKK